MIRVRHSVHCVLENPRTNARYSMCSTDDKCKVLHQRRAGSIICRTSVCALLFVLYSHPKKGPKGRVMSESRVYPLKSQSRITVHMPPRTTTRVWAGERFWRLAWSVGSDKQ